MWEFYALEVEREHEDWPEKDLREKLWTRALEAATLVEEPELAKSAAGLRTLKNAGLRPSRVRAQL